MNREIIDRNVQLIEKEVKKAFYKSDSLKEGIDLVQSKEMLDEVLDKCDKVSDQKVVKMYYKSVSNNIIERYINSGLKKITEEDDVWLDLKKKEDSYNHNVSTIINSTDDSTENIGKKEEDELVKKINFKIRVWMTIWVLAGFFFLYTLNKYSLLISLFVVFVSLIEVVHIYIICVKNEGIQKRIIYIGKNIAVLWVVFMYLLAALVLLVIGIIAT